MADLDAQRASTIAASTTAAPALVRTIGRWSLTAAIVNAVVGSAIFGMPATVASLTGAWSPLAVLVAGIGMFPIVLCFAEVGSRFDAAGGPYLYAREAFGRVAGFHVGWIMLWTRLLSGAAVLNVLVTYLAQLVPWVGTAAGRATTMTVTVALVTGINVVGVRQGAWTVNVFTVAKLLPLLLLVVLGLVGLDGDTLATQAVAAPDWTEAVLLLVFAYGGFEAAMSAAGETRRPREDTAFALVLAMLAITAVYAATQLAVVGLLPNAAASKAPVADALGTTMPGGLVLGSVAAVISTYGWLTGFALLVPRVPYAMAERGELPAVLGRVHAGFRTPHVSIVLCSAVILALGLYGSFAATATLSAISRLIVYGITCGALFALRRPGAPAAGWLLPGGRAIAVLGIAFSLWLLSTRSFAQAWLVGAIIVAGALVRWGTSRAGRSA
jgi:basic amino acid/polyamine antiporter, APA family